MLRMRLQAEPVKAEIQAAAAECQIQWPYLHSRWNSTRSRQSGSYNKDAQTS